jgi:hypothetical protein
MSENCWASDPDVADAITETACLTREALIARLTFVAPALTDDGLRALVVTALTTPQRRIDGAALAEAQRERESAAVSGVH